MEPLGLYISVPFCRAKCTFCNFASGVYPVSAMPAYVAALERQLQSARSWAHARSLHLPERIDTIYLGGGTPSLLPPALLTSLFATIRAEFVVDADAEITLEAAPLQLEPGTLEAALAAGMNRVSFGVQSFVEVEARATARTHSGEEVLAELGRMREAGVPHVSADLIAGLPGQTGASWTYSVTMLAQAPVDHASVYMFELDEDSRLGAEALRGGARFGAQLLPKDDVVADWYEQGCEQLGAAGLEQYEISNFARPGGQSRHNERYWLRSPYLGIGVDAHSMLRSNTASTASQGHGLALGLAPGLAPGPAARFAVGDGLDSFLDGDSWEEPRLLTQAEALEEAWFLGLRRNAGVSLQSLRLQFGESKTMPYLSVLQELGSYGLIEHLGQDVVALTARGRLLSNDVFAALLLHDSPEDSPKMVHHVIEPATIP